MRTVETTFIQLCEEVDVWKEEAAYWKAKYQQEVQERNAEWQERSQEAQKGIANALHFMLAVKDDENGNLVIDKESRKELGDNWV